MIKGMDFSLPDMWERWDEWPKLYKALSYVSLFDHWLSEEEFVVAPFVDYFGARAEGLLDQYYAVEEAFLALYKQLIGQNVVLFECSRRTNVGCEYKFKRFKGYRSEVRKRLQQSIRELRRVDIYIPHLRLRVLFNWHLTHSFFFEDDAFVEPVLRMVKESGVHVISTELSKPTKEIDVAEDN